MRYVLDGVAIGVMTLLALPVIIMAWRDMLDRLFPEEADPTWRSARRGTREDDATIEWRRNDAAQR